MSFIVIVKGSVRDLLRPGYSRRDDV